MSSSILVSVIASEIPSAESSHPRVVIATRIHILPLLHGLDRWTRPSWIGCLEALFLPLLVGVFNVELEVGVDAEIVVDLESARGSGERTRATSRHTHGVGPELEKSVRVKVGAGERSTLLPHCPVVVVHLRCPPSPLKIAQRWLSILAGDARPSPKLCAGAASGTTIPIADPTGMPEAIAGPTGFMLLRSEDPPNRYIHRLEPVGDYTD